MLNKIVNEMKKVITRKIVTPGYLHNYRKTGSFPPLTSAQPKKVVTAVKRDLSLEWKPGTACISIRCCPTYGDGAHMATVRKNSIPMKIFKTTIVAYSGELAIFVTIPATPLTQKFDQVVMLNSLQLISNEEYDRLKAKIDKDGEAIKAEKDRIRDEILNPPYVKIMDRRDYITSDKDYLITNSNFVRLGMVNTTNGDVPAGVGMQTHTSAGCCAFSKICGDLVVNVPVAWVRYFGYTVEDLKAWISFLCQCEIGFDAYLKEENSPLIESHPHVNDNWVELPNGNTYLEGKMPTYQIVIKGSTSYAMHTYMYFILVRYIYNHAYWTIPFIAMQIKLGVDEELTFWECLVLAHANECYNDYYSLAKTQETEIMLPGKSNLPGVVLKRLQSGGAFMNTSFNYTRMNQATVSKLIRNQDYKGLIELVKNHKNN